MGDGHYDFFNAWAPATPEALVDHRVNDGLQCNNRGFDLYKPEGADPKAGILRPPRPPPTTALPRSFEQIVAKAKAALAAVKYVHAKGSGEDQGTRIAIDMRYGPDEATGTLMIDGQMLDDERFSDLTDFTDLRKSAYDFLDPSGQVRKGARIAVAGVPAIEIWTRARMAAP